MELYETLEELLRDLDISVRSLRKTSSDYAKAYSQYRVALAKELVKLKSEGYAITLAGDIARGKPEIAHLKFKEISTEGIYKANLESINATKLRIKIIQEQINKEYNAELSD